MSKSKEAIYTCKAYVGDRCNDQTVRDLVDAFTRFGPLREVWTTDDDRGMVHVSFEDGDQAEEAMRSLDGKMVIEGCPLNVQLYTCSDNSANVEVIDSCKITAVSQDLSDSFVGGHLTGQASPCKVNFSTFSSTKMTLDKMPKKLLVPIIDYACTALKDKLKLRMIAKRWNTIIGDLLRQQTQLSLYVIAIESDFPDKASNQSLSISTDRFDEACIRFLGCIFTSLSDLTINIASSSSYKQLPQMLGQFSSTLNSLTLEGKETGSSGIYLEMGRRNSLSASITVALNSLNNLATFKFLLPQLASFTIGPKLGPLLARLDCLIIHSEAFNLFDSFVTESFNGTELQLPASYFALSQSDETNTKLITLAIDYGYEIELPLLGSSYCALQRLAIDFSELPHPMAETYPFDGALLRSLAPLRQLSELYLKNLDYPRGGIAEPLSNGLRFESVDKLCLGPIGTAFTPDVGRFFKVLFMWFPDVKQLSICCRKRFTVVANTNAEHNDAIPSSISLQISSQ